MKKHKLFYNGKIYTQADNKGKADLVVDSMAVVGNTITAVGRNLHHDDDFKKYDHINLKGRTVIPGLVDAHTHFYFMALTMATAKLDGLKTLKDTLEVIKRHSKTLKKDEWVTGEGFAPTRWDTFIMPDRYMLDKITGGRPAAIWSKDQHMMWVNSRALEIAGINKKTRQPNGGKIELLPDGEPSGILKEIPGYFPVVKHIKKLDRAKIEKLYRQLLKKVHALGVTGVHSMDGPDALSFFDDLSKRGKLGLRINYYAPGASVSELKKMGLGYGYGNDYFRLSGLKMFADGSLGSQTALCFNKYKGSKGNYGVEVTPVRELVKVLKTGIKLGLPGAIHAIGDKAVANVLDVFEQAPVLKSGGRHRIEHVQMMRRKDIPRFKRMGIIASMQPSHCPSDIEMVNDFWGARGRNCYIFKTLLDRNVPLAFGSDAPIEILHPISGIHDAVNRKKDGIPNAFYPKERLSVSEAVYNFTVGPAYAVSQEFERGYLLPGYKADFVILSENIYKSAPNKIRNIRPIATFFDGSPVYIDKKSKF